MNCMLSVLSPLPLIRIWLKRYLLQHDINGITDMLLHSRKSERGFTTTDRPHRQLIKFTRRWSGRNVFYHENKVDITKLTQQMSGGVPGSQAFLGALQDATTSLWKKLSSEEQDQYAIIAKEWSNDRPPKDIQAK